MPRPHQNKETRESIAVVLETIKILSTGNPVLMPGHIQTLVMVYGWLRDDTLMFKEECPLQWTQ